MDYKAFVSSTYIDLKDHRAHVIRELRRAGFFVDPMEDWTSSASEPKEFSRERLEGCHLCVLLIARRRGYVPSGENSSITQMEFDEARRRKIDVLPFLLDDSVDETSWPWEEGEIVKAWRDDVLANFGVETFKKTASTLKIAPALTRWIQERGPQVALRLYLENVRREHGTIKFVSLPKLEDNADAPIQRLFVEPAVSDRWLSAESDPKQWPETKPIIDLPQKLVLLGDPGSGKSTLVNWIAWQLASHHDEGNSVWTDRLGKLLPLPMILRELGVAAGITWDKLVESFLKQPPYSVLTMANLLKILSDGQAMIMLDGLDEIGNPAVRRDLREAVWDGMKRHPNCKWLLTSRIVGYEDVAFDSENLGEGVQHTDNVSGKTISLSESKKVTDLAYVVPFDDARVSQFLDNWFVLREESEHGAKQGAVELLEAIRADEGTKRLGRIPNLLTMMALIWRIEAHLPNGRALLCHKIAEAYLYTIDRWKRIDQRAERLEDRRRWLARVGLEMQRKRSQGEREDKNEIFATAAEVRRWIAESMKDSGRAGDAEAGEFVDYLARRTGLLLERGEDRFAFLHLSFQEYFAGWHLKEEVTTPAWALRDETAIAPGASPDELAGYTGQTVWREAMVFLVELLAAEDPKWLPTVLECLFGKQYAFVATGNEEKAEQAVLLARLSVDPQAGLMDEQRCQAVNACCCWEAREQKRFEDEWYKYNNEVLRVLSSVDSENKRRTALESFAAYAEPFDLNRAKLDNTRFDDLSPLSRLRKLKWLHLSGASVSDLAPVSGMGRLQWLLLSDTSVSNLTPLSELLSLLMLDLRGTSISDLAPLSKLQRLQYLDAVDTLVSDLAPLSGLTSLKQLLLNGTLVSNVTPMLRLGSLEVLALSDTPLSDVAPLSGLGKLQRLYLNGTSVSELNPLSGLESLEYLDLRATPVSDLTPLAGLTKLRINLNKDQQVIVPKELESRCESVKLSI